MRLQVGKRTLSVLAALLIVAGCTDRAHAKCAAEARRILYMPARSSDSVFAAYSPEDAYRVFMCGYLDLRPGMGLFAPLARKGAIMVPVLRNHLLTEQDGVAIVGIVQIMVTMQRLGTYDVRADTSLVGLARRAASRSTDTYLHNLSTKFLAELEPPKARSPGNDAPLRTRRP